MIWRNEHKLSEVSFIIPNSITLFSFLMPPELLLKLAQAACVCHACAMRSLAIVITIVQSFSLSLLFFFFLRLLLLTHFGETPVCSLFVNTPINPYGSILGDIEHWAWHKVKIFIPPCICNCIFWGSRRLACATRGGGRKRSWPFFSPTFFLLLYCHTLVKVEVKVETRVGIIIRWKPQPQPQPQPQTTTTPQPRSFLKFSSISHSILTKVET